MNLNMNQSSSGLSFLSRFDPKFVKNLVFRLV